MKKTILTIFICLLLVEVSFSQDELNIEGQDWLAIKTEPLKKEQWINPMGGTILSFKQDKLYWQNVFRDSTIIFNYNLKGKKIILNDSVDIVLNFISKDSLILVFDKRNVTTFIPIQKTNNLIKLSNIDFSTNNWTYQTDLYQQRIDFSDNSWGSKENGVSKVCVTHDITNYYQRAELWNFTTGNNFNLFTLTHGQFDNYIHQVLKQNGDTIFMQLLTGNRLIFPVLIKHKMLNKTDRADLTKQITSKKWNTIDIIANPFLLNEDSVEFSCKSSGIYAIDTTLISKKDFLDKKLKFMFSENKYEINVNENFIASGTWELSLDGKYIVLNNGCNPTDFIELIEVNENNLVIGKSDKFGLDKKRHYEECFYQLRLE